MNQCKKTKQFKTACKDNSGYVAKNSKNQKGDITYLHIAIESMC